jgi:hypothetical protein
MDSGLRRIDESEAPMESLVNQLFGLEDEFENATCG